MDFVPCSWNSIASTQHVESYESPFFDLHHLDENYATFQVLMESVVDTLTLSRQAHIWLPNDLVLNRKKYRLNQFQTYWQFLDSNFEHFLLLKDFSEIPFYTLFVVPTSKPKLQDFHHTLDFFISIPHKIKSPALFVSWECQKIHFLDHFLRPNI